MDIAEKLVLDHLRHRGYTSIIYEPDGNIPPDFLIDETIAVEVRRLNQNHFEEGDAKGLEEVAIPLWNRIKKLVGSLGAPTSGESWFVSFTFSRPVEPWKDLGPKLKRALEAFRVSPIKHKGTVVKAQKFELDVFRASRPHATMFVMGGCSDRNSGGWVLSEMETNLRYCICEKSRKIGKVRSKYGQWWLVLVDHIGYGLDEFDRGTLRAQMSIEHDWDKIILIDPRNCIRWFEI